MNDGTRQFAAQVRGMGILGQSVYGNVDGVTVHDIPAHACKGRAGTPDTPAAGASPVDFANSAVRELFVLTAAQVRELGVSGHSVYSNVDGVRVHDIPAQACKGRAGALGQTFTGFLDEENGTLRFDCVEAFDFWLKVDLNKVPRFALPSGAEGAKSVDRNGVGGQTFTGFYDEENGRMRFDCVEAPDFWLEIDLKNVPRFALAPGAPGAQRAQQSFVSAVVQGSSSVEGGHVQSFPKVDVCLELMSSHATDKYYMGFAIVPEDHVSDDEEDPPWQVVAMLNSCKERGHESVDLIWKDLEDSMGRFVDTYAPDEGYCEAEGCLDWLKWVIENARSFSPEPLNKEVLFTFRLLLD